MSIGRTKALRMLLIVATVLVVCYAAPSAQASGTVAVGTCRSNLVSYSTIQAAVTAVPAGTTIDICPGVYPEQVTINKNLTLVGVSSGTADAPVVVAPAGGMSFTVTLFGIQIAAQIFVQGPATVNISHIIVDGSANGINSCALTLEGILYLDASGIVTDTAVRNELLAPADNGCQSGLGIDFESDGLNGTSTATITNNTVRNYQKNGITVNGPGNGGPAPTTTITGNTVVGEGPTMGAAENGIQVGFGAAGKIMTNIVYDDIYTGGANAGASGILVYASTGITVSGNTVGSAQYGVAVASDPNFGSGDGAIVTGNKIGGTLGGNVPDIGDGIDLCSDNNTAKTNMVNGSAESGVHVDDECMEPGNIPTGKGNTVTSNTINEACAGVLLGTNSPNTTSPNTMTNVTTTLLAGDACTPSFSVSKKVRPQPYR